MLVFMVVFLLYEGLKKVFWFSDVWSVILNFLFVLIVFCVFFLELLMGWIIWLIGLICLIINGFVVISGFCDNIWMFFVGLVMDVYLVVSIEVLTFILWGWS